MLYTTKNCEYCFQTGYNPKNVDELCPVCNGYGEIPEPLTGILALPMFTKEIEPLFKTKREAIRFIS